MIKKFQKYIEEEPWENSVEKAERLIMKWFRWVLVAYVLYFAAGAIYGYVTVAKGQGI